MKVKAILKNSLDSTRKVVYTEAASWIDAVIQLEREVESFTAISSIHTNKLIWLIVSMEVVNSYW